MEGGRTSGEGREGRGLVAGVKAAFKGRPRGASKSRSGPHPEETPRSSATLPATLTTESQRSPKSPILGWRKSKHRDSLKGKEGPRSEEARLPERQGQCSRSQALRLSHHSLPNYYTSYALNSNPGKAVPSAKPNGSLHKGGENCSQPRALSPSWQAVNSAKLSKVEENDSNSSRQPEGLSGQRVSDLVASEASQRGEGGVKGLMAGSDKCDGQQGTLVVSHVRGGGGAAGEGESEGVLCHSQRNKGVLSGPVLTDEAFRDNKYYEEAPLSHDREPWLRSALRYSLRVPQCPRNEVVVLALGVDQYVEEVFRFLDQSGAGRVGVEDFHGLCRVLGLEDEGANTEVYKCQCLGPSLTNLASLEDPAASGPTHEASCPAHMSFREFRERLCEVFIRNADAHSLLSLGARRPANSPLVTSVVSVQRRYEILEAISRKLAEVTTRLKREEERLKEESGEPVCGKCQQVIHVDRNSNISPRPRDAEVTYLQRQVLLQQQELQCLREVIDDLRVALQSSDAENLALQVQALRLAPWRQQASLQDLSITDEENTIDNLVRQLAELDPQSLGAPPGHVCGQKEEGKEKSPPIKDAEQSSAAREVHNTAFVSSDASLESELQATYEALQAAREQQEATQADLQQTVGQLQQREADLRRVEESLQNAQSALGQAHTDNLSLVTEVANARDSLEESRAKLTQALSDLQLARDIVLQKEKQLEDTEARLDHLKDSKARVVSRVGTARELVAGSLGQVRAGEHALAALAAHATHVKLEEARRADSGLYSEDSERDEDTCPDRSSEHASASEEDLWSLRGSDVSAKSQPIPQAPQTVTSPWITADSSSNSSSSSNDNSNDSSSNSSSSSNDSSGSSSNSSSDDGYKTEAGEASLPSPAAEPVQTSTTSSREIIEGLERELEWLQHTLEEAEREWLEESPQPAEQEATVKEESVKLQGEAREDEGDKERLSNLEDQLKQLLEALISVADMNMSRRTLGRLVLEAVQDASDAPAAPVRPGAEEEEPPISLLTRLLSSLSFHAPDKHGQEGNDWLFHSALRGLAHPAETRERVEATMG